MLYRGPLSSCNYDCRYCPFAKRHESAAELRSDRLALERFVGWVVQQTDCKLSVLFTPWGEALTRRWYQQALVDLSHVPQVEKVAIQTNLSCSLNWLSEVERRTAALWCTFHPSQISRAGFLAQVRDLDRRSISHSVGVVGLRESFDEIERLRCELPPQTYLWINAYKDEPDYYSADDIARLEQVDPHFRINLTRHASYGEPCVAGETSVSIDGDGNLRRCHFVGEVIGNIYQPDWQAALRPRPCPNQTCGCYIGYIHLPRLQHERLFAEGVLERIPATLDRSVLEAVS
jgi:MoaA/NifB/PqqE/SkfB family radical SAM enzyme